ncbi:MAG: HAD family phosphatase [Candidatus Omnitrophica bacterium]|nr:HAD family phosphatase [Candidatus Omnitrophota bacterium]
MSKTDCPKIRAVIFDLGNVLLNYDAYKAAKRFAKQCKVPLLNVWIHFFTSPTEKAYTRGEISSYAFYRHAKQSLRFPVDYKTFKHYWNDIFWENEGMDEVLRKLKKHYPLYLISNTNQMHFDHVKEKFRILRHFKKTFPSHEMGARKPDPEIYLKVLKKARLLPQETVFIDDVEKFVEGARKVGMHAIRFRHREQLLRDLHKLSVKI